MVFHILLFCSLKICKITYIDFIQNKFQGVLKIFTAFWLRAVECKMLSILNQVFLIDNFYCLEFKGHYLNFFFDNNDRY